MSSAALYYAGCEDYNYQPHFLEACSLCSKPLGHNTDIFMYRGNTPFCSQDCREEQIEIDEAKERKSKLSSSKRSTISLRKSTETTKNSDHPIKDLLTAGTVSVA